MHATDDANARFLTASLDWLGLVLRRHAQERAVPGHPALPPCEPATEPATEPAAGPAPGRAADPAGRERLPAPSRWLRRRAADPPRTAGERTDTGRPAPAAADRPAEGTGARELAAAAARIAEAEAAVPAPPLVALARRLGLSRFERDVLLMCLAEELSPSTGALFAAAHGVGSMAHPTFGLALAVLPDPSWEALSAHGPLRYWGLVEISHTAGAALVTSPVRADERIVDHVKGLDHLDERLRVLVTPLPSGSPAALPASQRAAADRCADAWELFPAPVVHLVGAQPGSKRLVAAGAAASRGLTAYRLPVALLPERAADADRLARLWEREAALTPVALYVDADDGAHGGYDPSAVGRFLSRTRAPVFFGSRDAGADLGRAALIVDVAPPTPRERAEAWRDVLGPAARSAPVDLLARQFALDLPEIAEVAAVHGADRAWDACLDRGRPRLDGLAQRLRPEAGWDDIVLPERAGAQLRRIADQVARQETVYDTWGFGERRTRGLGVTALFTGPSGTGKTMAAEVLAAELGLDLYRTDLSAVMSKYIGETEKNLRRLFDAAEAGGAVLFLDEAEALLGTRSEVKDAHDRYANVQVDYLLQRLESHRGLTIMATNMRAALDAALVRRLRFVVEFPFPDVAQRREIWRRAFPEHAPGRDGLDYERLARLDVSGAMARTIALNSAFLAAADGGRITMPLVLRAAREEFHKLQQPVRERDFVWPGPVVVQREGASS
ncbi:AAA family ATPase [Streptomyces lavendulae]|uniref:AAA family ATPase n=1 Tax=Streptomyces lavendulae TaxID=1914 RepID=UPI00340227FF